ncbi:MAG: hypothetical protein IT165_25175 [Bryobacterales bacterium]|nr:hypothetical protein [Bryobacterales bacterium]
MERDIAVYSYDGALLQWIDQKRFKRLFDGDRLARVVKTRAGRVKRVTLRPMPGEWKPSLLSDYNGTKYSFQHYLDDGHRCYRLRALGDNRNDEEYYLAPEEARPIFLRVLVECLVPAPAAVGA